MKNRNRNIEQVRRLLDGDLDANSAQHLRRQMEDSLELQNELKHHGRLREFVSASAGSFAEYFPERVAARLHALSQSDDAWISALLGVFRRVILVAVLLMAVMITHNISTQWQHRADANAVEMTLAIPPATIASSLDFLDFGL